MRTLISRIAPRDLDSHAVLRWECRMVSHRVSQPKDREFPVKSAMRRSVGSVAWCRIAFRSQKTGNSREIGHAVLCFGVSHGVALLRRVPSPGRIPHRIRSRPMGANSRAQSLLPGFNCKSSPPNQT